MKNVFKIIGVIALATAIGFSIIGCDNGAGNSNVWVDPATQTTQLAGGTVLVPPNGGNIDLPGSPYGYEIFVYPGGGGTFTWYGAKQGGGGAFKAEWNGYYLARLGYYWDHGGDYKQYRNIYIDYNFNRTANSTSDGGFIGSYGWVRSPSAAIRSEKCIEYYIVDDWFYDNQLGPSEIFMGGTYTKAEIAASGETLGPHLGAYTENGDIVTFGTERGSFEADGATYKIYTSTRLGVGIDPLYTTCTQVFSVRQGRRTHGTISVTEHFNEWSKYLKLDDLYEVKFKVEAFSGNGNLDLTYLYLSQERKPRE